MEEELAAIKQELSSLRDRVKKLEEKRIQERLTNFDFERITESVSRVLEATQSFKSAKFCGVPSNYYDLSLESRKELLKAPTIHHLCKSILLENTACTETNCDDPENSRYYIIMIQYSARLHSHKVFGFVRSLKNLPRAKYHFRLAESEESAELTGFEHNAMSPLGITTNIPIIVDEKITKLIPQFMWMGGGDVDLKLGVSVKEFLNKTSAYVADISH